MDLLLVEDEEVVARRLQRLVLRILGDRCRSLERATSLAEAREKAREHPVDLVFLDLNLRGEDGFRLLEEATAESFRTIVVSAHHHQALRAFEYGVVDFVPKPFGEGRLRQALERVEHREQKLRERIRWLGVRKPSGVALVPLEEIVRIEGAGDYSRLVCRDGKTHLHAKTLKALETLLPARFARVHRCSLVDLEEAEALIAEEGSRYSLRMKDGSRVQVGRTRVAELRERLR